MATKVVSQEYLDEALANLRLSLNKDLARFATKEDLLDLATKSDLAKLKNYTHEVARYIVDSLSETHEEHLRVYHGKKAPATN